MIIVSWTFRCPFFDFFDLCLRKDLKEGLVQVSLEEKSHLLLNLHTLPIYVRVFYIPSKNLSLDELPA